MRKYFFSVAAALLLLLGPNPRTEACSDHRPEEYVVLNMQLMQVMVETYYQQHQRRYPPDLRTLLADAQQRQYYRHFTNPFADLAPGAQLLALKQGKPSGPAWRGMVGFQPVFQAGRITGYRIYGGDRNGRPIRAGEDPLVLRNGP